MKVLDWTFGTAFAVTAGVVVITTAAHMGATKNEIVGGFATAGGAVLAARALWDAPSDVALTVYGVVGMTFLFWTWPSGEDDNSGRAFLFAVCAFGLVLGLVLRPDRRKDAAREAHLPRCLSDNRRFCGLTLHGAGRHVEPLFAHRNDLHAL